jgi:hypothetical protein
MQVTISKEHTLFRSKLKFVGVEWAEIRPTHISKGMKAIIVRFLFEQEIKRCGELEDFSGKVVNEISGG